LSGKLPSFPIRINTRPNADQELVIVQKPAGMNTHRPDLGKPGLLEILEAQLGHRLYVVHRLDRPTSGIMVFAKTAAQADSLRILFAEGKVKKEYLFLTDARKNEDCLIESEIRKSESSFVSIASAEPNAKLNVKLNAKTRFCKLRQGPRFALWMAFPETGKPHQIRLHAQAAGIPILGDTEHGGSKFFRLCLHAHRLSLGSHGPSLSSPTWLHENITDSGEFHLQEALWRRKNFLDMDSITTGRWAHHGKAGRYQESPLFSLDQLGEQLWMSWYGEDVPELSDDLFAEISRQWPMPLWVRQMKPRGGPQGKEAFLLSIGNPKPIWLASESSMLFEMRANQGLSPGLFLDQRENRTWVREQAQGRRVLNLFSYTGAFSLAAWSGGAREIVTVDVSRPFIEWSRSNFRHNGIDPDSPGLEFFVQDCLLFLGGCQKRKRKFDLIICDPPTLGRSKHGTFDLKRDLAALLKQLWSLLSDRGLILFSCNYEGWESEDLRALIQNILGPQVHIQAAPGSPLDFEVTPHESIMKSFILTPSLKGAFHEPKTR
jgi:23S rRNA (cytosine1962-C5)-methyltransferase